MQAGDPGAHVDQRVAPLADRRRVGQLENWGGYPAARAVLRSVQGLGGNTLVITGDSHNVQAYNLAQDGRPAAVEVAGHGVTSPGHESALAVGPRTVAAALVSANPELGWCDMSRRGCMTMAVSRDQVSNDWIMKDTVKSRSPRASVGHTASLAPGRLFLS